MGIKIGKIDRAKERVLVFAPHPDDDAIGCGASIVKHIRAEREVFIVYAGDTGPIDCSFMQPEEYAKRQRIETIAAAKAFGLQENNIIILDHHPWKYSEEKLRFEFMEILRDIRPRICYLPHLKEAHIDHQAVANAAIHAIGMAPSPWFRKYGDSRPTFQVECVLAYEVWTMLENPNYFEPFDADIWAVKEASLRERKTQEVWKYIPASKGINIARAAMHEGEVAEYAEAFQVLKATRLF